MSYQELKADITETIAAYYRVYDPTSEYSTEAKAAVDRMSCLITDLTKQPEFLHDQTAYDLITGLQGVKDRLRVQYENSVTEFYKLYHAYFEESSEHNQYFHAEALLRLTGRFDGWLHEQYQLLASTEYFVTDPRYEDIAQIHQCVRSEFDELRYDSGVILDDKDE
jgi:hypothetical protein